MRPPQSRPPVVQPEDASIRLIALTQGQVATVDAADYDWLMRWNWCAHWNQWTKSYYARRRGDNGKLVGMHAQVLVTSDTLIPDHINGNTLDNRRVNLRLVSRSQNNQNRSISTRNRSGFKGVFRRRNRSVWLAQITEPGKKKRTHLGSFPSPEDAARAYDRAAEKHFGPFAKLNFPPTSAVPAP